MTDWYTQYLGDRYPGGLLNLRATNTKVGLTSISLWSTVVIDPLKMGNICKMMCVFDVEAARRANKLQHYQGWFDVNNADMTRPIELIRGSLRNSSARFQVWDRQGNAISPVYIATEFFRELPYQPIEDGEYL